MSRTRGRWATVLVAPLLVLLSFAGACNLLTGEPDRVLDDGDGSERADRGPGKVEAPPDTAPIEDLDAGADADGVLTIAIGTAWASPNGARWRVADGGTSIFGWDASHPIIVPAPQPSIPSESYTVHATVRAPSNGEFGILARVQPTNGSAVLLSSRFGTQNYPWLGTIAPPEWNPAKLANGASYGFTQTRYRLWLNVSGRLAQGKMWEATKPEPTVQVTATLPWATGRGVGFYTYFAGGNAVLEELEVTVP